MRGRVVNAAREFQPELNVDNGDVIVSEPSMLCLIQLIETLKHCNHCIVAFVLYSLVYSLDRHRSGNGSGGRGRKWQGIDCKPVCSLR